MKNLNEQFRLWLKAWARRKEPAVSTMGLTHDLQGSYTTACRKFTCDEMNEQRVTVVAHFSKWFIALVGIALAAGLAAGTEAAEESDDQPLSDASPVLEWSIQVMDGVTSLRFESSFTPEHAGGSIFFPIYPVTATGSLHGSRSLPFWMPASSWALWRSSTNTSTGMRPKRRNSPARASLTPAIGYPEEVRAPAALCSLGPNGPGLNGSRTRPWRLRLGSFV